jgi:hypothetical protein
LCKCYFSLPLTVRIGHELLLQMLVCTILTGDVKIVTRFGDSMNKLQNKDSPAEFDELLSLRCTNSHFLTWSAKQWFICSVDGTVINKGKVSSPKSIILYVDFSEDKQNLSELFLVTSSDVDKMMTLDLVSPDPKRAKSLQLREVAALSRDKRTVFTLTPNIDDGRDVICYSTVDVAICQWSRVVKATLSNSDELYSLVLSADERFIVGMTQNAFKRWHIATKRLVHLKLPLGIRNFPRSVEMLYAIVSTVSKTW